MKKCEYCGLEHDGNYGSGRFCSQTCARKFSNTFVSEAGRANQIKALVGEENRAKAKESRVLNNTMESQCRKQYRDDLRPTFDHTLSLGKIGELEVSKKFIQHGYRVYVPLVDNGDGIDLVVANENGFKTVQVKSSAGSKINLDGSCETTMFKVCQNVRRVHNGSYTQTHVKYDPNKVNYIALYSAYNDEAYLLENSNELSMNLTIRSTINNGQKKKVHFAEDCTMDRVLTEMNLIKGVYYDENATECNFKEVS